MFTLTIKTENAAFEEDPRGEIARILEEVVTKIHKGEEPSRINDINGNSVCDISWNI